MALIENFLTQYYLNRPGLLVLYVLFSLYAPVRGVIIPQYFAALIRLVESKSLNFDAIKSAGCWVLGLWTLTLIMQTASGMIDAYHAPIFKRAYRQYLLGEIMRRHRHQYQAVATGDATVKLYESPYATFRLVQIARNSLLPVSLTLIAAFFFYYRASPLMGLGMLVAILVLVGTAVAMMNVMIPAYGRTAKSLDKVHEWVEDVLRNLQAVLLSEQIDQELDRHQTESDDHFNAVNDEARKEVWLTAAALLCRYVFMGISISLALYLRSINSITTIAPIILVTTSVNGDVEGLLRTLIYWSYYIADVRKMDSYFDSLPSRNCHSRTGCEVVGTAASVQFDTALIQYDNHVVFPAATMIIPAGTSVVITGSIGCGKSTLARVLTGTMPYFGSVTIGNCEVNQMTSAQLAASVAYVPQSPRLFDRTLEENLLYGLTNVTTDDVARLIGALNQPDFPTDLHMRVGKDGSRLSGGQRSICYLLRAVLKRTKVIILDEPTAAMDACSAATFFDVAQSLLQTCTVIVITHDENEKNRWMEIGAAHVEIRDGELVERS